MADISGEATTKPIDPADWRPLLQRFAAALSVVIDGLAEIAEKPDAARATGPTDGNVDDNDGATGAVPRSAELVELLAHNDTRAEQVMAEIRAAWTGPEPRWLADAARAITDLDYPGAIERLRAAGALDPS